MFPLYDENPTELQPLVTVFLIGICIVVFLWQLTQPEARVISGYGLIPADLFADGGHVRHWRKIPASLTVISSMFMHGGWMHLIGNMLFLWIFGNNVEDAMGHVRFSLFYIVCGVIAALAYALPNTQSMIPMVGASGAVSGVLGAYLLLYPAARIMVVIPLGIFIHPMRLPAVLVLGIWIVFQLLNSAIADPSKGGVAWGAHVGGFLAGMALIPFFKHKNHPLFANTHRRYRRE